MARRVVQHRRVVGRKWENDADRDVDDLLRALADTQKDGATPAGFSSSAPVAVGANTTATAGTEDDGWSSGAHAHQAVTGEDPVGFQNAASEGGSNALSRADHIHQNVTTDSVDDANPAIALLKKDRAGTKILTGDIIGEIRVQGMAVDGNFHDAMKLQAESEVDWNESGANKRQTSFVVQLPNPLTMTEAMRVRSDGSLVMPAISITDSVTIGPGGAIPLQITLASIISDFIDLLDEHSAKLVIARATEEISVTAATTDSSVNLLPADSLILGVGVLVTETITRATTQITDFSVGDPTTADRFAASVARTAGSTASGRRQWRGSVTTDAAGPTQDAAAKARITTSGGSGAFTAGKVRLVVFYQTISAPAS